MTDIAATLPRPTTADASALPLGHPRRWLILFVILAAECMDILDSTIVNVAAPSIRAELHTGTTGLQWIAGGYALTYAVGLIPAARLGDIHGRRRLFLIGTAGFTLTSLLCGLAPSTGTLILFRLLQGACAALMIPQGFGIVRENFPPDELPKAFGMWGPVIALGAVAGPILGGVLVDADLFGTQWRMVFLINLPLGLLAIWGAISVLPESRPAAGARLDVVGAGIIAIAAGLVIYPLIQGRELDWPAWTFAMIVAGLGLLVVFAFWQRARMRRGQSPLITPSLLDKRAFTTGITVTMLFFAGMSGVLLALTLYMQIGLQYTAVHSGATLIPWAIGTGIGAGLGGAVLAPRLGRHALHIGIVAMLAATLLMIAVLDSAGAGLTTWDLLGPEILLGFGLGMVVAPLFSIILAGVSNDEVGSASGVLNAMQQLGSAIGVAVLGTIFFSTASSHGFLEAMKHTLWASAAVGVVVALLALFLPMHPREEEW